MDKLLYAIFYTHELERAQAFYESLFCATPIEKTGEFVGFALGDAILGIKRSSEGRETPGAQTAIIGCADLEVWWSRCIERSVTVETPITVEEWGRNFSILDLDGNKLEFVQSA